MDAVQITRVTVKVTMKHCIAWDDKEVKQEVSYIYQLVQDFFLHIISTNPKITRKDDLREKDRKECNCELILYNKQIKQRDLCIR